LTNSQTTGKRHHAGSTYGPAELKSESVAELVGILSQSSKNPLLDDRLAMTVRDLTLA
jgi:hypothetical protein